MTAKEVISSVRRECERRTSNAYELPKKNKMRDYYLGADDALCQICDFLDTLQVEEHFAHVRKMIDGSDEAAEDMLYDAAYDWVMGNFGNPKESLFDFDCRCFKAGAEWMAEQGETVEGKIIDFVDGRIDVEFDVDSKLRRGDKVIVQIRKT